MEENMNHWKPNGNFFVGDCMPFFRDGVFHLYYLLDVGHHNHPVVGHLGGHQFAHAVSTDLVHWTHLPIALGLDFKNGECSNCTGSMLEYRGRIFAFYALRSRSFSGEELRIAVSDDGGTSFVRWDLPELPVPSESCGNFRDPKAFIGPDGRVHLLISSGALESGGDTPVRIGEVLHFSTDDLIHYRREESFLRSLFIPECCDYFQWEGLYYFTCNSRWETSVRCSEHPLGPWRIPSMDVPASRYCCVMKTAPWKDGRRIGVGWVPTWENGPLFGGRTVFRELVRERDGSIGTAFVDEMIPQKPLLALERVLLKGTCGISVRQIGVFPHSFRLDGSIRFRPGTAEFGMIVMDQEQIYRRFISFDPQSGIVELDDSTRIRQVKMDGGEVSFRLVRTADVLDLEINGRRTVVSSHLDFPESSVALYVRDGEADFSGLKSFVC